MRVVEVVTLVSAIGQLALAVFAAIRAAEDVLARALVPLSVALFTLNLAELLERISGDPSWDWLDVAASSLTPVLVLHFVLALVGRRPVHRAALVLLSVWCGGLSLVSASAVVWPVGRAFAGSASWAAWLLGAAVVSCVICLFELVRHHRSHRAHDERVRTKLVIAALAIGATVGATDLLAVLGVPVGALSAVGTLVAAALLGIAAVRFGLFAAAAPRSVFASLAVAIGVVLAFASVSAELDLRAGALPIAVLLASLLLVALVRPALRARIEAEERQVTLASLGRMNAQLAHDLKNPIAAVKGAAQFLAEELRAGRPLEPHAAFLTIIEEQAERLVRIAGRYEALARVTPRLARVELGPLLERVAAAFGAAEGARGSGVEVQVEVSAGLVPISADVELLERALENLLRNAEEAQPGGARVTLRARLDRRGESVSLEVEDAGPGMDRATKQRALDDFFTTKPQGSGLGLAFVRRVVLAHGGELVIDTAPGRGTAVRMLLPTRTV